MSLNHTGFDQSCLAYHTQGFEPWSLLDQDCGLSWWPPSGDAHILWEFTQVDRNWRQIFSEGIMQHIWIHIQSYYILYIKMMFIIV